MDSQKPKTTRTRKTTSTAKPRRQTRKKAEAPAFNPGQVHLLIDLMTEFANDLEAPAMTGEEEVELTLSSEMPGLEEFMQFKLDQLRRQQEVLESLWNLG